MHKGNFRFVVLLSVALALAAALVSSAYHLPLRDPDGVAGPTYVRLPLILLIAFLADVLPRTFWVARSVNRSVTHLPATFVAVVRKRWPREHVAFALVGLGAWYLTYAAFRNLKSFVPFVNRQLWDDTLGAVDRAIWMGTIRRVCCTPFSAPGGRRISCPWSTWSGSCSSLSHW